MNTQDYWQFFLETGAPEAYLMFIKARNMEKTNVLDDSGISAACHSL